MNKFQRKVNFLITQILKSNPERIYTCHTNYSDFSLIVKLAKNGLERFAKDKESWYRIPFLRTLTQLTFKIPSNYKQWEYIIAEFILNYIAYLFLLTFGYKNILNVKKASDFDIEKITKVSLDLEKIFYGSLKERLNLIAEAEENTLFFGWPYPIVFRFKAEEFFLKKSNVVILVTEQVVRELMQTEMPKDWQPPMVYKNILFLVPKNLIKLDKNEFVETILVHDGTLFEEHGLNKKCPVFEKSERVISFILNSNTRSYVIRLDATTSFENAISFGIKKDIDLEEITASMKDSLEIAIQFLWLLATEERPVIIKEAERNYQYHHRQEEKAGDPLKVAQPRILDITPKPVIRYHNKNSNEISKGTPKRPHVRRAHWHTVRCGTKRQQTKKVWIKTTWIHPDSQINEN